jgi:hypothetical protein
MFALVVCPSTVVSFVLVASYTACAKIQGAAEFEVERSHGGAVLRAADYGITPGVSDCTDALNTLLDACLTNGTGRVVFGSGWYNFTSDRAIRLTNLKNFVFDGAGAEFVFFRTRDVNVSGCARLEMRDFTVDWDWGKSPLASLVEVTEATSDHVDFRFVHYGQFPRRDIRVAYTSPWDASTRSVDAQGDRPHGREIALEETAKTAAERRRPALPNESRKV